MADLQNPKDNKLMADKISLLEHKLIEDTIKTLEGKVKSLEDRIMEDEAKIKTLEEMLLKRTIEDRMENTKSRLGIPSFRLKEDAYKLKYSEAHKGKLKTLTEKLKYRQPTDQEKARHFALFMAVLLMMAMPVVVLRSLGQPPLLVWRLSYLLCGCTFFWIRFLGVTLRAQTSLMCNLVGFVLALYADAALDPKIGMLVSHLNVHVSFVMLGYALAERRQRDGREVSALYIPTLSKEKQERMLDLQILGGIFVGIFTLLAAAYIVWVMCSASNRSIVHLMISVFIPLSSVLMFWSIFVGCMLLQGALLGETGCLILVIYFISSVFLSPLAFSIVGDIGGMIVTTLAILGLPGFFGYSACIYASSKQWLKLQLAQESAVKLD
ncbi:hypothetical protein EJB05_29424 [Eragrostis curvula]|uniref:Uncharacterized protein n=1 Tax=Eragrostis curvula TaxID=38414 RepID=A0A5J9UTI8_9POAL|nr:hypothetical protein EJB05_29424 [Eragrostis curvula]